MDSTTGALRPTAVAVTGIGCRVPEARDHREFFRNLCRGVSSIREVDPDRWDPADFYSPDISLPNRTISKWCGQIDEPYGFDHEFFRMSPKSAKLMDPQQRLLLEETWHCIEDSGTRLGTLRQARSVVFVGVAARDHLQQVGESSTNVEAHSTFGGSDYMLANRLSHAFGLRGQSMAIDAACASSAVAVHLGIRALQQGDADFALAGGVLLNLHPWKYISYSKARMLSPSGLCMTFDKDADGFVPGDGVVMVMLRRLEDAVRDGDHIYGLLAGSAVNHNGVGRTITAPSVTAQHEVITTALGQAGFGPDTVTYVEAHGTGTAMGDPMEVEALHQVMSAAPRTDAGCWIGSVKPNVGHLEAAAGAAGLVKVLMMMRQRRIPPSVHLSTVNPLIKVDDGVLRLAREPVEWAPADPGEPLRAGVSSFGGGGVNAHLCVEEYRPAPVPDREPGVGTPQPFLLSASSARSLDLLLARWRDGMAADGWIRGAVGDICATLATGREHRAVRTGGLVSSAADIAALVTDPPIPGGDADPQDWELRVGTLVVPARERLAELLDSPLFAEEADAEALATLRAGGDGPAERFLFTYLVVRVLRRLGLQQARVSGSWAALAATGALDLRAGLALAHGDAEDAPLRTPEAPLVHAATGRVAYPYLVDGEYFAELLDGRRPDAETVRAVSRRAAPVIGSQWVVRRAIEGWNQALDLRGLGGWRIPVDEDGLAADPPPEAALVRVLALENAFDQLNREWKLSLDRLVPDPRMTELLELLADGLLSPDGVLSLLAGDADDRAATVDLVRGRLHPLGTLDDARYPVLSGRRRMPAGLETAAAWQPDPAGDDPAPAVTVGSGSGAEPVVIDARALSDGFAAPLLALWLRGVPVDWDLFYAGRRTRKVPLPTTEFVRTVHRQTTTTTSSASRLVELDPEWVPEAAQAAPAGDRCALVIAPESLLDAVRPVAADALPGYRLAFAGVGGRYRHDEPGVWTVRPGEDDWDRLFADLGEQGLRPRYAVRLPGPAGTGRGDWIEDAAVVPFLLARSLLRLRDAVPTLIVDVALPGGPPPDAAVALGRCLRWETSSVRLRSVTLDGAAGDPETWRRIAEEFGTSGADVVRHDGGVRYARRFALRAPESVPSAAGVRPGGVYLVTGGGGGLGRAVAAHLLSVPGVRVALAGRSLMSTGLAGDLAAVAEIAGDRMEYFPADVSDLESTRRLVADVRRRFGPVNGVVHAAGILRDRYLVNTSVEDLHAVLGPKVRGAANLDLALDGEPLDFFALFSSLAAVTGNPGQVGYACANALMEAFAADREDRRAAGDRRGRTVAIGWPWWDGDGMTIPEGANTVYRTENGFAPMPVPTGLAALDTALAAGHARRLFLYGDAELTLPLCQGEAGLAAAEQPGSESEPWASRYVTSLFSELLDVPAESLDLTCGLDGYGIDSIQVRVFNARVERDLGAIPHTLLFECRTLAQVGAALEARFPDVTSVPGEAAAQDVPAPAHEPARQPVVTAEPRDGGPVAVIGVAGRYPKAPDLETFWENLAAGRDCVSEIPASRWDHRERFTEDPGAGTYCKWGGFLDGVDRFDPLFFGISPREAELMDPQERLFLQTAWHAFEDAGYPPYRLGDPDVAGDREVGVFVGVTTQSYLLWGPDQWRAGNMVMPTSTLWSIPNRVSYCLDLRGPSMPVDTACASSLTALHLACESLAKGECRLALVGAVNLYLHPSKYDWLCQMRMLTRTGHCHTFGARADGFVPGEGVGAVVLKPLADAVRDGDRVLGVIRGTAVNHGGRTSGFTVPNPRAQAELVANAMRAAGLEAGVGYLEAHGTGTSLGDPIEIAGLHLAFERLGSGQDGETCAIGSVKTNIGHLEAAAGLAGLTKVLLQMRHRQLVPSLHADPPNPSIDFSATPLRVQREPAPWVRRRRPDGTEAPLSAGISAFGAGGANAHVVVEEYLGPLPSPTALPGEHLVVVSAKDPERLRDHCRNLAAALRAQPDDVTLAEVAYELQVRREPLPERVAVLVGTMDALVGALDALAAGREPGVRHWSRADRHERAEAADEFAALGRAWVAGNAVRWETRYERPLRHVGLPGYPFADERYWIPEAEPAHPFIAGGAGGAYTARFTGDEFFLDDHRVHGERIFPAVGYLELARAAAEAAGHRVRSLSGNVWASPVVVSEPRTVQVELSDDARGPRYAVYSLGQDGERVVHGQGRVETRDGEIGAPDRLDLAGVRARCPHALPGGDYYPWLHQLGLELGRAYQGVRELRWGDGELLSEYRLPGHLEAADRFVLHPATLDSAIQGALWLLRQHDGLDHLHLPFTMGSCEIFGPTPSRGFAHVVVRASGESGSKLDVQVADEDGNVAVRIRDFWLRRWPSPEPSSQGTFLRPEWVAAARAGTAAEAVPTLILVPTAASGRSLAAEVERTGAGATVVLPEDGVEAALRALPAGDGPCRILYAWPRTAFTGTAESAAAQVEDGFMPLFHLVRGLTRRGGKGPVRLVCACPADAPAYQALGGFLRTAGREIPRLVHRMVELPEGELDRPTAARLAAELDEPPGGAEEVRYRDGERQVRRWRRVPAPSAGGQGVLRSGGTYLVTGGAGGLGALVAEWLAVTCGAKVVVAGRSAPGADTARVLALVRDAGGEARYVRADVSTADGAEAAVRAAREAYGELNGVVHAAGVLRDGYLANLDPAGVAAVLGPKVYGTLHLDAATRDEPLDFFCLFASLAGPIGNVAQATYAYANTFLDGFAAWRERRREAGLRQGRTMSVDWPLWADGGMAVDEEVRESLRRQFGIRPLGTSEGLGALSTILDGVSGQVAYVPGDGARLAAQLCPDTPAVPDVVVSAKAPVVVEPELTKLLTRTVAEIVKLDPARVRPDEQIGGYGFDSLAFNRLANQVGKALDLDLTPATFFEYTTIADLAGHLLERHPETLARHFGERAAEPPPAPAPAVVPVLGPPAPAREPIAIIGMYGMMPGSRDLAEFWSHLDNGDDLVTEIPPDRWDWRDHYSETPGEPGRSNSKWGAFLPEIDTFDARFFGISPREAELMDPQQRLFLQTVYRTIEEAGYAPSDLGAGRTGLFVGVASHDYYDLQREAGLPVEAYTTTGYFHSILANRVSYLLGLKGPSVPVDAACSSSLVAIRSAIESIWAGSSDVALAGGINLLISPMIYISFSRAGMLSPTGRCRTFDQAADGYVRGEGAGAVLLKPLSRALRDGDHVHAVIRGSAVNHGGKVNTLTTPNPNAQADLIVSAFEEAGIDPETVGYMEMHGTGTALGDPIEVNGLKKAFRELRRRAGLAGPAGQGTLIGSVKSNIGHLEAAAGMAGLFKVILAMRHGRVPGNLHINEVNPHIRLDSEPLRIARTTEVWSRPHDARTGAELPRRAGVSSFGFGGINAHLLLEEHVPAGPPAAPEGGEQLLVLSARTAEQLAERADDLAAFLGAGPVAPVAAGAETELVEVVADLLGVPASDVPTGESLEDLGLGTPRLRQLEDRIAERHQAARPVLPSDTLTSIAARITPAPGAHVNLRDVAYTLQAGREPLAYRLGLVAASADGAAEALRRFARSGELTGGGYSGQADPTRRGTPAPVTADLRGLAEHWVSGGDVNWADLHGGDRPRRVSLPTYPFARVRHWFTPPTLSTVAAPAPVAEPSAGRWAAFPEPVGDLAAGLVFRIRIAATDPVVAEHRVRGAAVLPGVGHLELVRAAIAHATPEAGRVSRVVWLRPLVIPDGGREVLVRLLRADAGVEYQVQAAEGAETITFSQGVWETGAEAVPRVSPEELRGRCLRTLDPGALYERFSTRGIDYGPFFRGLREIRVGDGEVFATARTGTADAGFGLHPTLMDAALQAIAALEPEGEAGTAARLPFALDQMAVYGELGETCHIHVRSRGPAGYDVDLTDERGHVLVALRELSVRTAATAPDLLYYVPYWERRSSSEPIPAQGTWLVVHPDGDFGLGREIVAAWPEQARTLRLDDLDGPADLAHRLRDLGPISHVWFLGGLKDAEGDRSDPAVDLFRLVKVLAETDRIQGVETFRALVNGVHDVTGRRTANPAAGGLVGLVKALGKEFPRIATGCVDIGVPVGGALTGQDRAALVRAVLAEPPSGDDEVALVGGVPYVRRLRAVALPPPARPVFRERGTYLIVGGAGGIGGALARHLAATRRARLVLVGRRRRDAEIDAELAELARLGGDALYRTGDVTDARRLADIVAETRERFGSVHGAVHAAMVLRDGIVERMDETAFTEVIAPKARGTEALGEALRGEHLDFLVHLSSVQSFTGSAGQANYAAASTAQDAYARRLAGRGTHPVKVVNWGYWGSVGRVASDGYRRGVTARGFHPISTSEGMDALERILAGDEPQVVAVKAEPETLASIGVRESGPHRPRPTVAPLPVTDADERERAAGEAYVAHALLDTLRRAGHTDLADELGAQPKHRRLVRALTGILVRHGLASRRGDRYVLGTGTVPDGARLRADFPDLAARLDLVDACLAGLPRVLSGTASATEVLFPGGSTELLSRVYRGERLAAYCNEIVAGQVAEAVLDRAGDRQVRVLEIGAGTGSTTEVVLDRLRSCGVRVGYDFTDVSDAFLRQAQRTYAADEPVQVRFRRLDISEPATAQGFTRADYDVVLAGNVIHAVTDVVAALAHTRELLAPGGRLVLTEVTQVQAFHTVTFGLLDGWWQHEDEANRLESAPLLDISQWRRSLEHAGYQDVQALGTAAVPAELSQRVIVAHAPAVAPPPGGAPGEAPEQRLRRLISELTARTLNMPVEEVTPGESLSALGVDSIVGVELINRLNTALGITLKTIVIFDHPTVAGLAAFILDRYGDTVRGVETPAVAPPDPVPVLEGLRAVRFTRPGSPRELSVVPAEPVPPGPGEVEIQVRAFPINFSDLLLAKGLYPIMPDYPFTPGVEVSGVVGRVGPGVSGVRPGDEVIALTRPEMGGQASVVLTDENFVVRKPANITHEEACGFPAAFLAMYLAFEWAQIKPGERVLVPAATGTNALIAVQLARLAGAEVVATAGSPAKADFLAGIGVRDTIDHARADVVAEVLHRTGGRGVDVVINTLGGQAIQQGLSVLAPEGRYVEVAVFGLQSSGPLDLSRLVDNQRFYSLNAKKYFLQHPDRRAEYLRTMVEHLESGKVKPFVGHVLPFDRILDAYALKEDRATIGRVVVTVPQPVAEPAAPEPVQAPSADIAVIGMAARFPGARDVDELWANLAAGTSAVRDVPESRWSDARFHDPDPTNLTATYCRSGGFLDDVDLFDAPFFSISGKEAEQTDPQQRVFLEEAWRALEDAGYTGERLAGRACGVFVGAGASEYLNRMNAAGAVKQAQAFWGNEASILAARISYFLNLKGPSVAVNTACSSSLVALHLACQSLLSGETDMSLAGGAFITLSPDYFIVASNGNMLSPEGRCKTFDAAADGFGPGEGVGVLVLKRLDAALRDGDQIHGVIKGTAINQDGRTNGITAPSGLAQTEVELAAYRRAGVDPATIGYVEAHGTGTPLGDPIEVEALTNAFKAHTDRTGFCAIGSIKTNIGHTAAAAGIAGVIKVLLSLRHGKIPPSLNFVSPNPLIDFTNSPFFVNTELRDWAADPARTRRAAVSGFGFSGTNAHVVIEEAPRRARPVPPPRPIVAVPVSAHTATALDARLDRLASWLEGPGRAYSLQEIAYNYQVFREHWPVRAVFLATDPADLARRVRDRATDAQGEDGLVARHLAGEDVDWRATWGGVRCDRIPLPGYAFDRHRYWYTDVDTVYAATGVTNVPATLTGQEFYVRDHVVDGRHVLPGVAYPELARRAAASAGLAAGGQVRDLTWLRPVEVNGSPVDMTVHFSQEGDGLGFEFRVADVVHARGVLTETGSADAPRRVDLRAVSSACTRTVPVAEHYGKLRGLGLVHGPALTSIEEIRVGEGVLLARLRIPAELDGEPPAFDLHPSLMDGALQTLGAFGGSPEGLMLPVSVAAVTQWDALPAECFAYVTALPGAVPAFDVRLLDHDGRELASLRHLSIRRDTDVALRTLLHRLRNGEISETEAELAMEASLAR